MRRRGFTLLELMIVVIIIGILVAVAVPHLAKTSKNARDTVAIRNAAAISEAIERYELAHGKLPGFPVGEDAATEVAFIAQLTHFSDGAGKTSAEKDPATYPLGPYLRSIPFNPIHNSNRVRVINLAAALKFKDLRAVSKADIEAVAADAFSTAYGWIYSPDTGDLAPNDDDLRTRLSP